MADRVDPEKVLQHIKQLSFEPFYPLVAQLINSPPTPEAIQAYANKYPDKYYQALTMAIRMVGYHKDAPAIQNNMFVVIQGMSDSELRQLNQELEVKRKELMERTVNSEVVEVKGDEL